MTEFTSTIDAGPLRKKLKALRDLAFVAGALDGVASDFKGFIDLGFKGQIDPWGSAWARLKPSTIRGRRKGKGTGDPQILRDTGVLQNSITAARDGPMTVRVGTTVPYAPPHQFGASIQHAARSIRVRLRKVKIDGKVKTRFAKDSHKKATVKWGTAEAWTVKIPARPFLPLRATGVDLPPQWIIAVQSRMQKAAMRAVKGAA